MPRLPRLRGREIIGVLRRAGFVVLRIKEAIIFCDTPTGDQRLYLFTLGKLSGQDC